MSAVAPTSLDRFLWQRGAALCGVNFSGRGAVIALGVNAITQTALGLTFSLIALFNVGSPIFPSFITIGPICLLVGIGLGLGARSAAKRLKATVPREVRLTPEAVQLILQLMHHVGWQEAGRYGQHHAAWNPWAQRSSSQVLDPETFQFLERAASAYNRAYAWVGKRGAQSSPALERLSPAVEAAADEAMVVVLNHIASMKRIPESAASAAKPIEAQIAMLEELASKVEAIAGVEPTFTESLAQPSAMRSVLEQLRMEEQARQELGELHDSGR